MIWFLYALLSAIFLSLSEIFQKRGLFKEHALDFNLLKYFFSFLMALFLLPFISFDIPLVVWLFVLLVTLIGAVGNLYRAKAYKHMDISSVAPFFNLSPAFVAIIAFFFLGETLSINQFFGIIILIAGAYILEVDHNVHSLTTPLKKLLKSRYIHYILFVLTLLGFGSIIDKKIINSYLTPIQFLFLAALFISFHFFTFSLFKYGFKGIKEIFKKGKKDAFFSALFWMLEIFFYLKALSLQLVSLVVPIKRLNTLFTTIGGGAIFRDKGLYLKAIACIIMLFGAYLIAL